MAREQLNTLCVLVGQTAEGIFLLRLDSLYAASPIPLITKKIWDFISHENVLYIFML